MKSLVTLVMLAALCACSHEKSPPLEISKVRILAAMPGSEAGVAYMEIKNNSMDSVTIMSISSPQFENVEMHETTIVDGIARMRPFETLVIPGRTTATFESGSKHLMLVGTKPDVGPGSLVTLEIRHNNGLLVVSATLQARLPSN